MHIAGDQMLALGKVEFTEFGDSGILPARQDDISI